MKVVAFVPIRLNSKRVPGKNLRLLAGRPLLTYILDTLCQVHAIDEIYLYASDNAALPVLPPRVRYLQRPVALDSDDTRGAAIYEAFTQAVKADVYILAHATSPFVRAQTITHALSQVLAGGYDSAFSAERIQTFAWYAGQPLNYDPTQIPLTQDIEPVYAETSAFYIFKADVWHTLGRRIGIQPYTAVVDRVEGIDIDYPEDFAFAERIAAHAEGCVQP